MDNAQVTGLGELGQYIQHKHNCTLGMRMGKECECGLTDTLARHRLERSEPVGCQYPVHGSVTHVRNVECCDFCGHPADTTPLNPVAEIERLREAAKALVAALESDKHYFGEEYNALRAALGDAS